MSIPKSKIFQEPSLGDIDKDRIRGLRPVIVGCFLCDKKVLFVFKKQYNLWMLPQGGIENNEEPKNTVLREMEEELGSEFINHCKKDFYFFGKEESFFHESKWGVRKLRNDAGEEILMKGKRYYFYKISCNRQKINIKSTEFDDYVWVNFNEALKLSDEIYQKSKRRIVQKILLILKKEGCL